MAIPSVSAMCVAKNRLFNSFATRKEKIFFQDHSAKFFPQKKGGDFRRRPELYDQLDIYLADLDFARLDLICFR